MAAWLVTDLIGLQKSDGSSDGRLRKRREDVRMRMDA
jgi:hypothetical protein